MDSSFNQEFEKLLNLEIVDFAFRASFYGFCTHFKPIFHQYASSIWNFIQHKSCSTCSKLSRDIKFVSFGLKLRKLCLVKVGHYFRTLRKFSKSKICKICQDLWASFLALQGIFWKYFLHENYTLPCPLSHPFGIISFGSLVWKIHSSKVGIMNWIFRQHLGQTGPTILQLWNLHLMAIFHLFPLIISICVQHERC